MIGQLSLFDMKDNNGESLVDVLPYEEIASFALKGISLPYEKRHEWPNADVIVDSAFVTTKVFPIGCHPLTLNELTWKSSPPKNNTIRPVVSNPSIEENSLADFITKEANEYIKQLEEEFGYEKNYRNDNSQITNKIHKVINQGL